MKNQELLNELKSFPKEFQPDSERQKKTLENILNFYDEYEKKNKKPLSFQKWQAAGAGLAAVLLASFLFLPNLLGHEPKSHQAEPPVTKSKTVEKQAVEKMMPAVSSTEPFHPKELAEVKSISIANSEGIEVKKVTDPEQVKLIIEKFKQAKLVAKLDKKKEDSISGTTYLFNFELKDGLLPVQYWPDEKEANFIDGQQRSWWRVEGLDGVLDKIQSTSFFNLDQSQKLLKSLHPDVNWENDYTLSIIDQGQNKVIQATGILPSGELLQLYIDPVTGKVIKEEKPESTAGAMNAVQTFFHLVGAGNYQIAWDLIHSKSQKSSGYPNEDQNRKSFNDYFKNHQLNLKTIYSAEWTPLAVKFSDCMCTFEKEVLIKGTLTDGSKIDLHAIKDDDNQWKLFWSAQSKALK